MTQMITHCLNRLKKNKCETHDFAWGLLLNEYCNYLLYKEKLKL